MSVDDREAWLCRACCAVNTAEQQRREVAERRDTFAAAALTLGGEYYYNRGLTTPEEIAARAFHIADAMLAARGHR